MAWKQSLAQIKKELKDELPTAPKPAPKPPPPPAGQTIQDEDALFLAAMGGARKVSKPAPTPLRASEPPTPIPSAPREEVDFGHAMAELKGVKPLGREDPTPKAVPPAQEHVPEPTLLPAAATLPPMEMLPSVEPPAETPVSAPVKIQLAAGMAIEVDGTLDLRNHSFQDGYDRLRERIQDARFLGWQTLHVLLGPSPELTDMLLGCILGSESGRIARYAQAPIPMGGAHAWILYLQLSQASPEKSS